MNFEPINIKIKELRRFTEIAYLIDSPLFIKEAIKIRKKYKITKPIESENIQQWALANLPKKQIPAFFGEVTDLRMSFGYDSNYQTVFEKAVLGGIIEDTDYKNTLLVNFSKLPSFLTSQRTQSFGILLTPQTDKIDVVATFKRYQKIQKELNSSEETYSSTDKRIDKRMEIERDRDWYWQRKKKMSYLEIAIKDGQSKDNFYKYYKYTIREAIRSYKRKLFG
jgi:hypothetical protein